MTFAQELVRLFRDYGQEISPEEAKKLVDDVRKTIGTPMSAAGLDYSESEVLARTRENLERVGPMPRVV